MKFTHVLFISTILILGCINESEDNIYTYDYISDTVMDAAQPFISNIPEDDFRMHYVLAEMQWSKQDENSQKKVFQCFGEKIDRPLHSFSFWNEQTKEFQTYLIDAENGLGCVMYGENPDFGNITFRQFEIK